MECQWSLATSTRTAGSPWYRKVDVSLISETHFTKQSYITFGGYKIYHAIHPENAAKGGSSVIIKENIHHHEKTK